MISYQHEELYADMKFSETGEMSTLRLHSHLSVAFLSVSSGVLSGIFSGIFARFHAALSGVFELWHFFY